VTPRRPATPCLACGSPKPAGTGYRYCSNACRPARKAHVQIPCKGCGGSKPSGRSLHYCLKCKPLSDERPTHCLNCQQPFTSTRRGVGWSRFCTRECAFELRRKTSHIGGAWGAAIDDFMTFLQAGGRSPQTRSMSARYLMRLARHSTQTDPWDVTPKQIISFLANDDWSPETRKSARSNIRVFYLWAEDEGHVERSPAYRLPSVRVPAGVPKPLPDDVFERAWAEADDRGQLMLMLGRYAGLRRGEVAKVHSRDVASGALRVRGKGGVTRSIPLNPDLQHRLDLLPKGWAFPGQDHGHVSANHAGVILKRLLGEGHTGHMLRHTFASKAYAGTRDLRAVQTLLGHSKPETTARYTAVPDGALLAAVLAAAS
jgi:integrase/recombinase XerC